GVCDQRHLAVGILHLASDGTSVVGKHPAFSSQQSAPEVNAPNSICIGSAPQFEDFSGLCALDG
ncbi:MAG TPA: hypothetical protein VKR26_06215, partial [Terriglobales bacterium]|nr:hypothetical protein [Terriglobales bacterium]